MSQTPTHELITDQAGREASGAHRYGRYLRIREEHLNRAHTWFERAGHWSLTFGYFIPGVRHFTAYAAGIEQNLENLYTSSKSTPLARAALAPFVLIHLDHELRATPDILGRFVILALHRQGGLDHQDGDQVGPRHPVVVAALGSHEPPAHAAT